SPAGSHQGGTMRRIVHRWGFRVAAVTALITLMVLPLGGQSGAKKGEWTTYGADLGNTRYSPLDQINADNFNKLELAWRFKTDSPGSSFGKSGVVDLKLEDDQVMDLVSGEIGLHATPIVAGNTVIVGAAHLSGGVPRGKRNEKGFVRGYDVKTGKRLWIFHTIPRPGEFGNDTWLEDS